MDSIGVHRPRNVDWKRAAALLYGDWGTSKAYVIGLAFTSPIAAAAAGYSCLPIIVAVSLLTALVGYNYIIVCRHFPDGGGVYSAARHQSRLLAVTGALLLVANFTVTAAMSGWAAMSYFGVPREHIRIATLGLILLVGGLNFFGPKHTGSLAVILAAPMAIIVAVMVAMAIPHLTLANLTPLPHDFSTSWKAFTWAILALSGVEAVANLTGVMKLDPGSSMENPSVRKTATRSITVIAIEVVLGTILLGWAMLSLPKTLEPVLTKEWEYMLRIVGREYASMAFGPAVGIGFGIVVGAVVGLLLLSAVNTAITALIGLFYMMARDGEMPRNFGKLNSHGVPIWPLTIAILFPLIVTAISNDLEDLAGLYAIGVVGAIAVNLGSCSFNKAMGLNWHERIIVMVTFFILSAVELTIAKIRPDALYFAVIVLGIGLAFRAGAQRRAGLRSVIVTEHVAAAVSSEAIANFKLNLAAGQTVLVAARGITPVLRYAMEEAQLRKGTLYVLYVKELAVNLPGPLPSGERPRWQDDKHAAEIMYGMVDAGQKNAVTVVPLYIVSESPAATILDMAATLGVDILVVGSAHRSRLVSLLKGDVVTEVARNLPENIQLVIYG
jgi:amino acid transporter